MFFAIACGGDTNPGIDDAGTNDATTSDGGDGDAITDGGPTDSGVDAGKWPDAGKVVDLGIIPDKGNVAIPLARTEPTVWAINTTGGLFNFLYTPSPSGTTGSSIEVYQEGTIDSGVFFYTSDGTYIYSKDILCLSSTDGGKNNATMSLMEDFYSAAYWVIDIYNTGSKEKKIPDSWYGNCMAIGHDNVKSGVHVAGGVLKITFTK